MRRRRSFRHRVGVVLVGGVLVAAACWVPPPAASPPVVAVDAGADVGGDVDTADALDLYSNDASSLVDARGAGADAADPLGTAFASVVARYHEAGTFDGVIVITRGDRMIYRGAVGLADRQRHVPHALDEIVRLASVAKQVTAALVMQELEHGPLKLDTTLATALPSMPKASQGISIRQLLQHTSGLPNPDDATPSTPQAMPPFYLRTGADVGDHGRVAQTVCGDPPGPPGKFAYDNCDYLVLGALLERATGRKFDALVTERIAKPLGLRAFRIVTPSLPDPSPVQGYLSDGTLEPTYNLATFGASGALVGTVDELAIWGRSLLQHRIVSATSTAIMFHGDPKLGQEALGSWSYPLAMPSGPPVSLVERQGSIGGMRSLLLLAPAQDVVIAIVANTERAELFELWAKKGLPYELVTIATRTP